VLQRGLPGYCTGVDGASHCTILRVKKQGWFQLQFDQAACGKAVAAWANLRSRLGAALRDQGAVAAATFCSTTSPWGLSDQPLMEDVALVAQPCAAGWWA